MNNEPVEQVSKKSLGSDDFSLSKVEESSTLKWYDVCVIYTTFTIIPTGIMLGVIIAKHFPFYEALTILALGSSVVITNALLMGFIGYRERTSFALTTRPHHCWSSVRKAGG